MNYRDVSSLTLHAARVYNIPQCISIYVYLCPLIVAIRDVST